MPSDVQSAVADDTPMTDAQKLASVQGYPVNEVFNSLQGEAFFTGTPSTFVRLQGCKVGCPWCDTKYTWHIEKEREMRLYDMSLKEKENPGFAYMNLVQLAYYFDSHDWLPHVVITGGEPCEHDLRPLIDVLEGRGHFVQVETSGTAPLSVSENTWVTVSPKFDMPGGLPVRSDVLERADEFKYPVGKLDDIEIVLDQLEPISKSRHTPIYLQPLSMSPKATRICIEAASKHDWRVSIQLHRYLRIR